MGEEKATESRGDSCPKCGVSVSPGYRNCPKCKAKLRSAAPVSKAGGTSVSGRSISLSLVLFLAAATMAITYLANRELREERGEAIVAQKNAASSETPAADSDAGPDEDAVADESEDPRLAVIRDLESVLDKRGVRVWTDFATKNQKVLLIRSDDCEEVEIQLSQFPDAAKRLAPRAKCIGRLGEPGFEAAMPKPDSAN